MLIIHLFSIITIKTTRALAALTTLGLLIVKILTSVPLLLLNVLPISSSRYPYFLKK